SVCTCAQSVAITNRSHLPFRHSSFGLISGFGFRNSDFRAGLRNSGFRSSLRRFVAQSLRHFLPHSTMLQNAPPSQNTPPDAFHPPSSILHPPLRAFVPPCLRASHLRRYTHPHRRPKNATQTHPPHHPPPHPRP